MKNYKNDFTAYPPRPKKVKHVHFISNMSLIGLEQEVNDFVDEYPEYKILGIRLSNSEGLYIATITYLCNAPDEFASYDDYSGDEEDY